MNEIANKLRDACAGHPAAQISWPHRLLHEAAEEIERLERRVDALENLLPEDAEPDPQ